MIENSVKNSSKNQGKKHKMAMSMTKTNSKIQKSKSYNKALIYSIYGRYWEEVIKKVLKNLENY